MSATHAGIRPRSDSVAQAYITPIALVLGGTALLTLASKVALLLSYSWVPMTLQPQAVVLVAALWPRPWATRTVASWLALGFVGAPVFAMGLAGQLPWLMPTAGYLLAYLPVALILERVRPQGEFAQFSLWLCAHAAILALGALWLVPFFGARAALAGGVAPFALADGLKAFVVFVLARPIFAAVLPRDG